MQKSLATEFGIPANGAIMNVRNAAPLTAGLVFGWPASVISGLVVGITSEVLHMLMVFLTNASDMQRAFYVVQIVAIPMIAANGISVMLSMLVVSLLGRSGVSSGIAKAENISQTFQRWLLV